MSISPSLDKKWYKFPGDDYVKHPEKYDVVEKPPGPRDSMWNPVQLIIRPKATTEESTVNAKKMETAHAEDVRLGMAKVQQRIISDNAGITVVGNLGGQTTVRVLANAPEETSPLQLGFPNAESARNAREIREQERDPNAPPPPGSWG
jgi:hypothetical protein